MHIEILLSFILFISAVILILYFVNPLAKTEDKTPAFDRVERMILENITFEFGRLSVICTNPLPNCCYNFDKADYGNLNYAENIIADRKIDIYFSDLFLDINLIPSHFNSPCLPPVAVPPNPPLFRLAEFQNESIIHYNALKYLADKGKNEIDYQNLKIELGINYDFSFNCTDINGLNVDELSFTKKVPITVEVQAREYPIRTINNSGQINEYVLNLRVW